MTNIILFILFVLLVLIICHFGALRLHRRRPNKNGGTEFYNRKKAATFMHAKMRGATSMQAQRAGMTYTIHGDGGNGLDYSILRELLEQINDFGILCKESATTKEKVNISFGILLTYKKGETITVKSRYPEDFYTQHAAIKDSLNGQNCFIQNTELYKTIKTLIPLGIKHIPVIYSIKDFESHYIDKANYPILLKKRSSNQQKGIKVITSKNEYYKAKKELEIKNIFNGAISEYIQNPMTVDGKKFHLRVHFLLSVINGITRCIAHDELHIITAKEKYIAGDWSNSNIHMSGGKNTDHRYIYIPMILMPLIKIN